MMLNKTFHLLLLSLIPLLGFSQANSQYPDSGNKIRLGFQTSGDGLIWRDTQPNVGVYQPINNKAAWIVLDTVNNKFYHYKNSAWTLAGGQDIDTANLIATKYNLGFKLSLADTGNMLTPYWRSGRFSGVLPVANGGTGQTTLAAAGINTGSGTLNYLPKYTATGTTLGNSIASDDGTTFNVNLQGKFTGLSGSRILTLNAPTNGGSLTFEASGTAFADMGSYPSIIGGGSATDFVFNTRGYSSLTLSTAFEPRITILSGGNVGIGTASPVGALQVSAIANSNGVHFTGVSARNDPLLTLEGTGAIGGSVGVDKGLLIDIATIDANLSSLLNVKGSGVSKFIINSDGNVGIGTTSPITTSGTPTLTIGSGGAQTPSITLFSQTGQGQISFAKGLTSTDPYDGYILYNSTSRLMAFGTAATERIRITSGGNVGIGTASPTTKLSVLGTNGTNVGVVNITDAASFAQGVGGKLSLTGKYNTAGDLAVYGAVAGIKENATDGSFLGDLAFYTLPAGGNIAEVMRILSNGNVGIGTASPTALLSIKRGASGDNMEFIGSGSSGYSDILFYNTDKAARLGYIDWQNTQVRFNVEANIPLAFHTNTIERMRITSAGNVGIGTDSPDVTGFGWKTLTIKGGTGSGNAGVIELQNTVTVSNDQNLGIIAFLDGTSRNSQISVRRESSTSTAHMDFFTNAGAGLVERMRITSGGVLCVGGTNTDPAANATNGIALTNDFLISINRNNNFGIDIGRNGTDGAVASFRRGSTQVGTISVTGSLTSYNVNSDYRLKQDFKNYNGLDLISAIKTYDYEWKSDKSRMYGVVAHELQEVIPYAVQGEKDGKEMQGVDYSKLVPILIKSVQELSAEIDILKQEIINLKNK